MKRVITLIVLAVFLCSIISAEIIVGKQPDKIYNLGDSLSLPITVKSLTNTYGVLNINLICEGIENNFYKNGISLIPGEEKNLEAFLVFDEDVIGKLRGECKIKAILGKDYTLTDSFKISEIINLKITSQEAEFNPGESIIVKGTAIKENMVGANGFVNMIMTLNGGSSKISQIGTISNGVLTVTINLPKDTKAGMYTINLDAYEKDLQERVTNKGTASYNVKIKQVPTNIEIISESKELEPGTNLRVKALLHDQTGEIIDSTVMISLKRDTTIFKQQEIQTGEILEFNIPYNEPPLEWKIFAISNQITSEISLPIKEKRDVKIELINQTLIVTNMGNVQYNETLFVKIGENTTNLDVSVKVGKNEEYILIPPNGTGIYDINIINEESKEIITKKGVSMMTGRAIDMQKVADLARHPFVWIFVLAILIGSAFIVFKKKSKKGFKGSSSVIERKSKTVTSSKESLVHSGKQAEISLSIQGEKQDASILCVKLKNSSEIREHPETSTKNVLQKISSIAEENKAFVYENPDSIMFIWAPVKTKTFKNEKTALITAEKIRKVLADHNRLFKQKIDFGISLNYGTIIAKREKDGLKFMSMGTLMASTKRVAAISDGNILLDGKIKDKLTADAKAEKYEKNGVVAYVVKELKDSEEHKKFINSFMKRMDKK